MSKTDEQILIELIDELSAYIDIDGFNLFINDNLITSIPFQETKVTFVSKDCTIGFYNTESIIRMRHNGYVSFICFSIRDSRNKIDEPKTKVLKDKLQIII